MSSVHCKKSFKDWQYYKLEITSNNKEFDNENHIDNMTWKQWLNNALNRSHGVFGEAMEYLFINQDDKIAYCKVNHNDKELFTSAVTTYISNDELLGLPLVVTILQETPDLKLLQVTEDDKLWHKKVIEEEKEERTCI